MGTNGAQPQYEPVDVIVHLVQLCLYASVKGPLSRVLLPRCCSSRPLFLHFCRGPSAFFAITDGKNRGLPVSFRISRKRPSIAIKFFSFSNPCTDCCGFLWIRRQEHMSFFIVHAIFLFLSFLHSFPVLGDIRY